MKIQKIYQESILDDLTPSALRLSGRARVQPNAMRPGIAGAPARVTGACGFTDRKGKGVMEGVRELLAGRRSNCAKTKPG